MSSSGPNLDRDFVGTEHSWISEGIGSMSLKTKLVTTALMLAVAQILSWGKVDAQEADHPSDKPLVVASDFGVAPWMVRGANGPEGFGADLIYEIGKELGR